MRAAAVEALAGDLPDVEPLADVLAWFRARLDDASPSVRRAALGALARADALAPTDVDRFAGPETHAADRQSLLQALEALPQAPGAGLSAALRAAPWSGSERAALRAALAPWDRAWIAPLATPTGPRDAVQAVLEATAFGAAGRLADVPSLAAHYRHALPRARQGKLTPTRAFGDPLAWAEARAAVVAAVEAIVQRERFFAPFGPLGPALALLVDALDDPDGTVREAASAALLAQFGLDRAVEPAPPVPSSVPLNLADLEARPRVAVLHTRHGPLALELLGGEAPRHAKSFALLARAGFYDGLTFHRVIAGFVAQGLCPLGNGWGTGGVHLNDEINPVPFVRGAVGMPSSGADTAGCQVFLTHVPTPHLDGNYTVFARVAGDDRILDLLDLDDVVERVELRP
ncbi:MAG: peptidylprolyl isomerase [Planctomycetota bacterium]